MPAPSMPRRRCRSLAPAALGVLLSGCLASGWPAARGTAPSQGLLREQDPGETAVPPPQTTAPATSAAPAKETATSDALTRLEASAKAPPPAEGPAAGGAAPNPAGTPHLVNVAVADLRTQPGTPPIPYSHDEFEETQVLYGEVVSVKQIQGDWALVEAVEQPEFTHQQAWHGYPGWILRNDLRPQPRRYAPTVVITEKWARVWADAQGTIPQLELPLGTRLPAEQLDRPLVQVRLADGSLGWVSRGAVEPLGELRKLSDAARRQAVLRTAELLVGDPYFWGGRSPYAGSRGPTVTGVDCSGLTNLAHRIAGLDIPRDAHEQYLRAKKVAQPEPGDLVFLSEAGNPKKIVHVMLYAGGGWLFEAPGTGQTVRRIRVIERFGFPIEQYKPGDQVDGQTLSFGTYIR